jgi:hypothetical protein
VEVPVFREVPHEIDRQKNVFIEVEKVIERLVDKLVEVPRVEQTIEFREIIKEKVVEAVR